MAFYETLDNRLRRTQEDRVRYPELEVTDYDGIAEVDAYSRTLGQETTSFGQAAEDASVRLGFSPEEVGLIESIRPEPTPPSTFGTGAGGFGDLGGREAVTRTGFGAGITGEEIEAGGDRFSTPGIRAVEHEVIRLRTERPDLLELGGEDLLQGVAIENLLKPSTRGLGELGAEVAREEFEPDRFRSQAAIQPAVERDVGIEPIREIGRQVGRAAQETGVTDTLAVMANGEDFINEFVNAFANLPAGLGLREEFIDFDIREQDWYSGSPRVVREIVQAISPLNLAAAGEGAAITGALRTAAQVEGRSVAARKALNGLAQLTEPFAARSFAGRAGTEIAAEVGALEGVRLAGEVTEGAPAPVRFAAQAAGLLAGGIAGGLGPEIIKGARGIPIGGSLEVGPLDALTSARQSIGDALREEQALRGRGIPQEELAAGRAAQFASVEDALAAGRLMGLEGEDLARFGRAGASVEGTIRQTFAEPLELTTPQRNALFDEVARMLRDGEIDTPTYLSTTTATARLIDGEGLRGFELGLTEHKETANALRALIGEEAFGSVVAKGPRVSLDRADAAIRRETDRFIETAERQQLRAAEAQARIDLKALDARIAELEQPIDFATPIGVRASFIDEAATLNANAIRARNAADATVRRQTERLNQQAITRQLNAQSRQAAKEFRQDFNLIASLESRHPNTNTLLARVDELMDQPITGTPRGEIPRGETGLATGARAVPDQPRVPVDLRDDIRKTIDEWLYGTEARLSNQAVEGLPVVRSVQAALTGQLDSPMLTWSVYRRSVLTDALVNQGVEPGVARQIGDTLLDEQLGRRLGDGFAEIRAGRKNARTEVRNRLRAEAGEQFVDDTTDEFRRLVDDQLVATFEDRYGRSLLAQEKRVNEQLEQLRTGQGFQKVDEFVQASKNTMFGLWDVGVLGIQVPTALNRGGVPLMAKMMNDALAVMHLPNARHIYSEGFLPKQVQYALDGVDQSARAAVYEAGSPSLIGFLGGRPGRAIDRPLTAVADAMTEFQFGTVLGGVRNAAYEGNLMLIHVAGMAARRFKLPGNFDVADPVVRQTAASFANNVGSSALPALRGNRNVAERILVTSNRMMRSRMNHITMAAKLLTPQATAAERVLAATTIVSSMFYTLVFAKFVNEIYGLTDYEIDPSKPGFGLITVDSPGGGEPRIIDTVPQDSTTRAFAKSIRILAENDDPALIAEAWARVYYGSASIIGRVPTTMFGYGYEPGVGFRSGDMTREGQIRSLAPIPPVFSFLYEEGLDSFGLALETIGVGNFPEGSYGKGNRALESAGVDPDELNSRERTQALADVGILHEVVAEQREELEEQAARGDRRAQALLVKYQKRDELQRVFDDSETKAEYRNRRRGAVQTYAITSNTFEDIWRSFGESDDETTRLAGQRYELRDQATTGTETDFDLLEELEAKFDAVLTPTVREDVLDFIESIDPLDNPWEQEYDLLMVDIAESGWWEIRDNEWTSRGFAGVTGFATLNEAATDFITRITQEAIDAGLSEGRAREEAVEGWQQTDTKQSFDEAVGLAREEWVARSRKNTLLADQMLEWGIWNNVGVEIEQYLDAVLAE